jgi:hypothetical protein
MPIGEELYTGAAEFGKISAIISLVFLSIVCIGLIIGGIYLARQTDKLTSKVTGTVLNANCLPVANNQYSCSFQVKYTVNGKEYQRYFKRTSNEPVQVNDNIDIYYDPENPDNSRADYISKKLIGKILIGIGIFVLIGTIISTILTFKFKFFAAAQGAAAGINLIRR